MMLALERLEVSYGQAVAVRGVSLAVPDGSWTLLIGPNGAGKTSLLRAAMGLVRHRGRVTVAGEDISGLQPWHRQRHGLGYVPEGRQLFPQMTVEENLRVGGYGVDAARVRAGIDYAFTTFPRLAERRSQLASTMSGGEQQMLALARALMSGPRLLLVDEISWGLSPIMVELVFAKLDELHRSGLAILQVEQNAHEALQHAGHAHVMSAGEITLDGPARELAADPRVIESYIGG